MAILRSRRSDALDVRLGSVSFDFGPFALVGMPPAADGGIAEAFAPRRTVLDN